MSCRSKLDQLSGRIRTVNIYIVYIVRDRYVYVFISEDGDRKTVLYLLNS